jgi:outer membrane protein assembly factor BamB
MKLRSSGEWSCWRRAEVVAITWLAVVGGIASTHAQVSSGLISQQQAHAVGLERTWFAHAQVDAAHPDRVRWILSRDQIVLLTGAGLVQLLDAHTGQTMWTSDVGNPNYPSLGPAANEEFVALVNGSTLYVLDRHSGQAVREIRLGGAPGAGPALGKEYVYTPLLSGRVEGYPLHDLKAPPWYYQSYGRAMVRPVVTTESVVWGTDAGVLCAGRLNSPGVRFRVETAAGFDAAAAYRQPLIFAASRIGELLAVDERTGAIRWRYVTGFPTDRSPAAVGDRVYVASERPTLHFIDAASGIEQWEAAGISQFAAAGKSHVYGIDQYGALTEVDAATGAVNGHIQSGETMTALVNDQTDRLYLITGHGLVQCLHEIGQKEPIQYGPAPPAGTPQKPAAGGEYHGNAQPGAKPEAVPAAKPTPPQPAVDNPFGAAPAEAGDNSNPFGAPAATPVTPPQKPASQPPAENKPAPAADDNPFGA